MAGSTIHPLAQTCELVRGDDQDYEFTIKEPDNDVNAEPARVDITGANVVFTMKVKRPDTNLVFADHFVVRKTSDDTAEIAIADQTGEHRGEFTVYLMSADTRFVDPGSYVFDVRLRLPNGRQYTVARGDFFLLGDVTSAEDLT